MITEVFELVDTTDDGMYYTLGIWTSLEDAMNHVASLDPKDLNENHYPDNGFIQIEIRERKIGPCDVGDYGKTVYSTALRVTWDE